MFFSGIDGKAYSSIPLKGTFRNTGLFVIAPEGGPTPGKAVREQMIPSQRF